MPNPKRSVPLLSGQNLTDLVEAILLASSEGVEFQEILCQISATFHLSPDDAKLAIDCVAHGMVCASHRDWQYEPEQSEDPIAFVSFHKLMEREWRQRLGFPCDDLDESAQGCSND